MNSLSGELRNTLILMPHRVWGIKIHFKSAIASSLLPRKFKLIRLQSHLDAKTLMTKQERKKCISEVIPIIRKYGELSLVAQKMSLAGGLGIEGFAVDVVFIKSCQDWPSKNFTMFLNISRPKRGKQSRLTSWIVQNSRSSKQDSSSEDTD
jgi:hypothetical protein